MKVRLPKGMGGGPQDMNTMIRQAQKMQESMTEKQAELEEIDRLKASREEFKAEYLKLIQHFMDDAQNSFPADLMASTPVGSAASPAVTVPAEPLPVADPVVPVADPFAPIDNFAADDLD